MQLCCSPGQEGWEEVSFSRGALSRGALFQAQWDTPRSSRAGLVPSRWQQQVAQRWPPEATAEPRGHPGQDRMWTRTDGVSRWGRRSSKLAQELPEVPQNPLLPLPASGFRSSSTRKCPNSCFPPSPAGLRAFLLSHLPEVHLAPSGTAGIVWEWLRRCELVELDFRKQL